MSEQVFPSLPYASLSDAALQCIREAILSGKLKPGQRILEGRIAAELGISRAPVREALRQLQSEGLLVSFPHRGTYVAQFSAQDAYEVYSLRAALEGLAASLVAEKPDARILAALRACVEAMREHAERGEVEKMIEADLRFHETLCHATGHSRLIAVWTSMSTQVRAFVSISARLYLTPQEIVARHQAVLQAIANGQAQNALHLLTSDIREVGQHVASGLAKTALNPSP